MPTATQSVTYLSKFKNFRFGNHQFVNGRLTLDDPAEIAKFDHHIAKGGRISFSRDEVKPAKKSSSTGGEKLDPVKWDEFTANELKGHASNAGITGASKMIKEELVAALAGTDYRP